MLLCNSTTRALEVPSDLVVDTTEAGLAHESSTSVSLNVALLRLLQLCMCLSMWRGQSKTLGRGERKFGVAACTGNGVHLNPKTFDVCFTNGLLSLRP